MKAPANYNRGFFFGQALPGISFEGNIDPAC
jgi:hypothetical protein